MTHRTVQRNIDFLRDALRHHEKHWPDRAPDPELVRLAALNPLSRRMSYEPLQWRWRFTRPWDLWAALKAAAEKKPKPKKKGRS